MSGSPIGAHFRGSHAPASLKRTEPFNDVVIFVSLPGQSCPGLIEAPPRTRMVLLARAALPGQSCPGLIEAYDLVAEIQMEATTSGAVMPRPH